MHERYVKDPDFLYMELYSQTREGRYAVMHSMVDYCSSVKIYSDWDHVWSSKYGIDCYVIFDDKATYRCALPVRVLNDHGIHFGAEHIQKWDFDDDSYVNTIGNTPEEMRQILYAWIQDTIRAELCRRRSHHIKEELVAAVWHPRRLARRLEEGGWDAVEALG